MVKRKKTPERKENLATNILLFVSCPDHDYHEDDEDDDDDEEDDENERMTMMIMERISWSHFSLLVSQSFSLKKVKVRLLTHISHLTLPSFFHSFIPSFYLSFIHSFIPLIAVHSSPSTHSFYPPPVSHSFAAGITGTGTRTVSQSVSQSEGEREREKVA